MSEGQVEREAIGPSLYSKTSTIGGCVCKGARELGLAYGEQKRLPGSYQDDVLEYHHKSSQMN